VSGRRFVTRVLFVVVLVATLANMATVIWSILRPDQRIWPPPRPGSWQYSYNAAVTAVALLGFLAVGVLDRGSLALPAWSRFAGAATFVAGGLFALWGYVTLGVRASQGFGDELVPHGPYRFSRNPQYVGTILVAIGYAAMTGSALALWAGAPICAWFAIVPFAEESWCREHLGAAWEKYAVEVPRFFGLPGRRMRGGGGGGAGGSGPRTG